MTLIYELDLDIMKSTCIPVMEFLGKVLRTDRRTETQTHATENITKPPHSWVVK